MERFGLPELLLRPKEIILELWRRVAETAIRECAFERDHGVDMAILSFHAIFYNNRSREFFSPVDVAFLRERLLAYDFELNGLSHSSTTSMTCFATWRRHRMSSSSQCDRIQSRRRHRRFSTYSWRSIGDPSNFFRPANFAARRAFLEVLMSSCPSNIRSMSAIESSSRQSYPVHLASDNHPSSRS